MKSIEIQRQKGDQWVHHAFYDDPELALSEAKRLVETSQYPGIRVIQDDFTDDESKSKSKYLFVSSGKSLGDEAKEEAGKELSESAQKFDYDNEHAIPVVEAEKVKSLYFPLIMLAVILVMGGGALIGMGIYLGEF